MLMKAHQDGSLWSCYNGVAIDGASQGKGFARIPAYLCQLNEWLEEHPDSDVLQWTEHPLHADPRHGHGTWFHFGGFGPHPHARATMREGHFDERLPESELVLGIIHGNDVIAFSISEIHRQGCVVQTMIGNDPVVVWSRSPASAWMAAFRRVVDGTTLDFEPVEGGFRDRQTGTRWSVEGHALKGKNAGKTLAPLDFVSVKWNAWSGFHPHTRVYESEAPSQVAVDTADFAPVLTALDAAGYRTNVEKERLQSSLPPAAQRCIDVTIDADPFLLLLFGSAGAASDYASSRLLTPKDLYISFFTGEAPSDSPRHAVTSGNFVLESNPRMQYSDPESLKRLPENEIEWSSLLNDAAFRRALGGGDGAADGSFARLFAALRGCGHDVRQVKPMLRKWLRPKVVDGYSAVIDGDRFLVYEFDSPSNAVAYHRERHHTAQTGRFVFRSDPPDQYQMATEQTIDRPIDQIHWSTLLQEGSPFQEALRKVG
jgi:hypothetical protein